jgi:putative RecB family exonuclease
MANHVHAALHDLFSLVPPQDRTVEAGKRLLIKKWRRYRVGFKNKGDERRWAQRALDEVTRFILEQDVTIMPLMLEAPIEAGITPGLILRGRVDRVDKQLDGSLHIIDYKTGITPQNIDWTQLELHSLILSRSTPYIVSKVSYLYLLSGIVETRQLDEASLDSTTWELVRVAKEIRAERDYSPNPGSACAGCDFARICPAKHEGYVKMGETDLPLWRDFSDILLED